MSDNVTATENDSLQMDYSPNYEIQLDNYIVAEGVRIPTYANAMTSQFNLVEVDLSDLATVDQLNAQYPEAWSFYYKDGSTYNYYLRDADDNLILDDNGQQIPAPDKLVKAVNFYLYMTADKVTANTDWDENLDYLAYNPVHVEVDQTPMHEYLSNYRVSPQNNPTEYTIRNGAGQRVDANGNVIPNFVGFVYGSAQTMEQKLTGSPAVALMTDEYLDMPEYQTVYRSPKTEYEWGGAYATGKNTF